MTAYIYQAALLCADCAKVIRQDLDSANKRPGDVENEYSYDSDDYPKGPYSDGGGEADCPQHCDACHIHLENPLTRDGETYVREIVNENNLRFHGSDTVREWQSFYSYLFEGEHAEN